MRIQERIVRDSHRLMREIIAKHILQPRKTYFLETPKFSISGREQHTHVPERSKSIVCTLFYHKVFTERYKYSLTCEPVRSNIGTYFSLIYTKSFYKEFGRIFEYRINLTDRCGRY